MSCATHTGHPGARRWSSLSALVSGGLLVALPKCPICLAAWLGVLGVAGAGALHGWLRVGLGGTFVVAVAAFAVNLRWARRSSRPT